MLRAALRIVLSTLGWTFILRMTFGLNGRTTVPVGADDVAHDLGLVERAAVGQRGVGIDQLDRRDHVVALADAGLVRLAGEDLRAEGVPASMVGRDDAGDLAGQVDPGRAPKPYCFAQ